MRNSVNAGARGECPRSESVRDDDDQLEPRPSRVATWASLSLVALLAACGGGGGDDEGGGGDGGAGDGGEELGDGGDPGGGGDPPPPPGPDPGSGGGDSGNFGGPEFPLTEGLTVATLALPQPSIDNFVLRATVPLPTGVYPGAANTSPFAIVNPDGGLVPAQTEIVSRYALAADGADVVELIAVVERDGAIATGQQTFYDVVLADHFNPDAPATVGELADIADDNPFIPASVSSLLATPGQVRVVAYDVFGNRYSTDLFHGYNDAQWKKYGHTMGQVRAHGILLPESPSSGPTGTLPHLFGVHAYVSAWAGEELVGLDLRIHNGFDGHDTGDPTDDAFRNVYFESIALEVPNGWFVQGAFEDPFFRDAFVDGGVTVFPLVDANDDGKMHMMPQTASTHRRLMLSPLGNQDRSRAYLEQEGLAFCQAGSDPGDAHEYWSWWNDNTARFLAQKHVLPSLEHLGGGLDAELQGEFDFLWNLFENGSAYGTYPVPYARMGWAHPYGVAYGGMTGGDEINAYQGVRTANAASPSGYRRLQLNHQMHTDRMPNAYFQKNGESSSLEEWLQPQTFGPGPYIEMSFFMSVFNGDPFGFNSAPTFQNDHVASAGLAPDYDFTLDLYEHHHMTHLTRYTRNAKALSWLGNDSMAKDDLVHQAEMFHLTYNEFYNDAFGKQFEAGMRWDMSYVEDRPGVGYRTGRAEGWGIDTMNCAYAVAEPGWRALKYGWFDTLGNLIADGQAACSGFLQANISPKFLDSKYRARQSIEAAIMENGIRGTIETVYRGRSSAHVALLEDVLVDSLYAMISTTSWPLGSSAPSRYVAVGPLDEDLPPWCGFVPPDGQDPLVDGFQPPSSLAYGYEMTGDPEFLNKAEQMVGAPLLDALHGAGTDNIYNRAALLALAQGL